MFSREFCEFSKSTFFHRIPLVVASEYLDFAHVLLIEDYEQRALRKEMAIVPFAERLKTATLRKSYS